MTNFKSTIVLFTTIIFFVFLNLSKNAQISPVFEPNYQYQQQYRQLIKGQNHKTIQEFNKDPSRGFSLKPNKFLHLKNDQFLATFGRGHISEPNILNQIKGASNQINVDLSSIENVTGDVYYSNENSSVDTINVDLTNYATPVRDQGACNSCYAHSTTATIQLMLNINGILGMDLSQQQMIDCSSVWAPAQYKSYNNQGCNGGWGWKVFHYVKYNGITTEANYPYVSGNTGKIQQCNKNAITNETFKISSYSQHYNGIQPQTQCNILDNTLKDGKPIAVSIYAPEGPQYQFYGSHETSNIQVFDFCGNYTVVTHEVMLLGATDQYWKLKNSYGVDWGMAGYMYLDRTQGLNCLNICMDFAFISGTVV